MLEWTGNVVGKMVERRRRSKSKRRSSRGSKRRSRRRRRDSAVLAVQRKLKIEAPISSSPSSAMSTALGVMKASYLLANMSKSVRMCSYASGASIISTLLLFRVQLVLLVVAHICKEGIFGFVAKELLCGYDSGSLQHCPSLMEVPLCRHSSHQPVLESRWPGS